MSGIVKLPGRIWEAANHGADRDSVPMWTEATMLTAGATATVLASNLRQAAGRATFAVVLVTIVGAFELASPGFGRTMSPRIKAAVGVLLVVILLLSPGEIGPVHLVWGGFRVTWRLSGGHRSSDLAQ